MWESFVTCVSECNGATGALIAASGALIVFLVGKIYEICDRTWREHKGQRRLILAIYLELRHNVADLENVVPKFNKIEEKSKNISNVISKIKEEKSKHVSDAISIVEEINGRTIHAVYSKGMRFISILEKELHALKPEVLDPTLRFYSDLEFIYASLDGFQLDSFKMASTNGKRAAYRNVIDSELKAVKVGNQALKAFKDNYGFLNRIN